jgi:hypothetical protein
MTNYLERFPARVTTLLAASAIAASGLAASSASAQPPAPGPAHNGCVYAGAAYSHGSTRDQPSTDSHGKTHMTRYSCVDGQWIEGMSWEVTKLAPTPPTGPVAPPPVGVAPPRP